MICPLCDAEVAPGGFVTATPSRPIDGKSYACEACHAAWRALLVDVLDTVGACGSAFASTIIAAGRAYLADRASAPRFGSVDPANPVPVVAGSPPSVLVDPPPAEACSRCRGSGRILVDYKGMAHTDTCRDCGGTGESR